MVLRAYSKWRNTYIQENLPKFCENNSNLWYLKQNPLHPHSHSSVRWKFHPTSGWRTIFPGGAQHQHFSSCPQCTYSWGQVPGKYSKKWGLPLLRLLHGTGFYLRCSTIEIPGALIALVLVFGAGVPHWKGKPRSRTRTAARL